MLVPAGVAIPDAVAAATLFVVAVNALTLTVVVRSRSRAGIYGFFGVFTTTLFVLAGVVVESGWAPS
ncbi:hypothetical protein [Halospeciosus flavus]|uniref:Uncharacterized protein n=1 Tax=Halospeciosus flavus TaxID=3032283 RepID=A0ABD5Z255_9EURY|nr:hypothetical protein [Halospeciosus flavus]